MKPGSSVGNGVPPELVTEAVLDVTGVLPSRHALTDIARSLDVACARARSVTYNPAISEMRERRAAAGLEAPKKTSPVNAEEFSFSPEAKAEIRRLLKKRCPGFDQARPRHGHWTKAQCLVGLIQFLEELPQGQPASTKTYGPMSRRRDDWPSLSVLGRHGSFAALLGEARRLKMDEPEEAEE